MTMRPDPNEQVPEIIDCAIAELILAGLQHKNALKLLAFQAAVRIEDDAELRELAADIQSLASK